MSELDLALKLAFEYKGTGIKCSGMYECLNLGPYDYAIFDTLANHWKQMNYNLYF